MATAHIARPAGWRAFLGLLWRADHWRTTLFGALVLVAGLLPTAAIVLTGALVHALPGAVEHGVGAPGGRPALLVLSALVAVLALLAAANGALGVVCRELDAAFALEVHHTVALATLATPGVAPLEDPAFADRLQAIQDADRRGVLPRAASELSNILAMRVRGLGAFAVLLAFRWWAPLVLAAAWQLTNLVYLRTTERGVSARMGDGATRMRRSEYLRSLALEAGAAKEVRVFGLGGWLVGEYRDAWFDALGVLWRSRRSNRALNVAAACALAVSHVAVLGALGVAAVRGELEVAALLVFAQAVIATSDLGLVGDSQWWMAQALAVSERVADLRASSAAVLPEPPRAAPPPGPRPVAVRLDGVRFTYRGREEPTLDGLTLEVPAGQSLAIVGENGAGKSTLIKLLCGLYDPDAGRVALDGARPLEARRRIGVIFQDFVRYPLPLRENVGFGHLPLLGDPEALEGALADAGGAGLPSALPRGWDTVLSREFEGGADLSGGQWQRVALARALAAVRGGAGLLILDEPTASLDVRAETELLERFLEVTRGVTTILVSHRLSSVRRADRIVVIHGGRVAEDGTHDELMRAGGRYARMFSLQAERFALQHAVGAAGEDAAVDA
jgi:ATP-binding cassette, subfamily B, bacterial